jgi:hypothetical protein
MSDEEAAELRQLADDIAERGLKFADMPQGQYEMPSQWEHDMIVLALRSLAEGETK